jgi:hypothetical protein
MSRAIPEATGRWHWATTQSVLPQQPPGQQTANKTTAKKITKKTGRFDGHGGALVQYRITQ